MFRRSFPLAILMFALPAFALASQSAAPRTAAKPADFRGEFFARLDSLEKKIVTLADATPATKFTWRPSKDVRSISEVYVHIAGANYFLASFLGVDAPKTEGDIEKSIKKKAEVVAELRKSFAHLRAAAKGVNDLEATVMMFGKQTSHQGVLMTMLDHLHEHLGQQIAYARMNGIVPPWSDE